MIKTPATPETASSRLDRMKDSIMQKWEMRALKEVAAAAHQNSLALRDSLPDFLAQLSNALSTTIDRTDVRVRWDRNESARLGRKHGRERAATDHYTMDQVIFEYHILRQVICEEMEVRSALTPTEREIVVCAVEQAVNDAATEFSETLRDIQEQVTHTLAHDLRGPITTAKMSAQLLLRKTNDPKTASDIASRISFSMDRLDVMIFDLLDASRLKAGEDLHLTFAECDLDLVLAQVADEANFLYPKRVELITDGAAIGYWDEKGLKRVIDNLMTNAIKFSDHGSIITLRLIKKSEGVEVSVHNIGIPMRADEIPSLFKRYQRSAMTKEKVGWGLGLTVVKGITEAHGGKVEVESTAEAGTMFKIVLPWKPIQSETEAAKQENLRVPATSAN